ncbi:hypothetical protein D927_01849 [Enterococcus faecalis 02-MB-BW-10]|nr:hypothetical protein D927_01849 [Enterococcus faecalis 02-MB-BW-10]
MALASELKIKGVTIAKIVKAKKTFFFIHFPSFQLLFKSYIKYSFIL